MAKLKYSRNEIWERKVYEDVIKKGELKVLFRPGDRVCGDGKTKCFYEGEEVRLRILERPGNEKGNVVPLFTPLVKNVKILKLKKMFLSSLVEKDFINSYPDVTNVEGLKYHLGLVYDENPNFFREVTKIELGYGGFKNENK